MLSAATAAVCDDCCCSCCSGSELSGVGTDFLPLNDRLAAGGGGRGGAAATGGKTCGEISGPAG